MVVPERVITDARSLTIMDIDAEQNAEVRRVMVEKFGAGRLAVG